MNRSKKIFAIICLNLFFSLVICSNSRKIASKFKEFKIVPQIIPTAPKEYLEIIYQGELKKVKQIARTIFPKLLDPFRHAQGIMEYKAKLGNDLPHWALAIPPLLRWKAHSETYYLLAMIDPDFLPNPSKNSPPQLFHWIVGNIPGNNTLQGEVLANYIVPKTPIGTGQHRYIFFIFEQPGTVDFGIISNKFLAKMRTAPSLKKVLRYYKINEHPIAGNFYRSVRNPLLFDGHLIPSNATL